jgi:GntR family transcriptional regulator
MSEDLEIRVLLGGAVPVYRQVVDQVRTMCVEGRLVAGERLPSIREMAGRLGVHSNTIADAYKVLAEEGWVVVEHGRGVRVKDRGERAPVTGDVAAAQGSRLRHLVAELRGLGLDEVWIRREVDAALGGGQR